MTNIKFDSWPVIFLLSMLYACVITQVRNDSFYDHLSYINYAENSQTLIGINAFEGLNKLLSNEPLWLLINIALSTILEPENVVITIVFITSFVIAWKSLINNSEFLFWILLFLFFPQVIKNSLIHLRQGVAIAIFLSGWYSQFKVSKWILILLTPFVHSSFFIVLGILLLTYLVNQIRLPKSILLSILVILLAGMSLSISIVGLNLGARQSELMGSDLRVSGVGFVVWSLFILIIILPSLRYFKKHIFEIGFVLFYLISYWKIDYSARIFESTMMLVFVSLNEQPVELRRVLRLFFILYFVLSWLGRINAPLLGFGM